MRDKSEKPRSEQTGRRNRALARSLLGRVLVCREGVGVVRGRPEIDTLAQYFERHVRDAQPSYRELGFHARDVRIVNRDERNACSQALNNWRQLAERTESLSRRKSEMRKKRRAWLEGIPVISQQVEFLYSVLDRVDSGQPLTDAPFVLSPDDSVTLAGLIAGVPATEKWPDFWTSVARALFWFGGANVVRRFTDSLRPFLELDSINQDRRFVVKLREQARGISSWLDSLESWQLTTTPSRSFFSETDRAYDLRQEMVQRAKQTAHDVWAAWQHDGEQWLSYLSGNELHRELDGPLRECVRSVLHPGSREDFRFLEKRCDEVLEHLGTFLSKHAVATLAALCVIDGGDFVYPRRVVRMLEDHHQSDEFRRLVGEPGYAPFAKLCGDLTDPCIGTLGALCAAAAGGATAEDIVWFWQRGVRPYDVIVSPEPLRRFGEKIEKLGVQLSLYELSTFCEALTERSTAGLPEAFLGWLELLPDDALDRVMAETVKNVALTAAIAGVSDRGVRDFLRHWASPKRLPRLDDIPDAAPKELTQWLRRIAFYQRMGGKKVRIPKSLRRPLGTGDRLDREREYLQRLDREGSLSSAQAKRLQHLAAAPKQKEAQWSSLVVQAKEVCAKTALDTVGNVLRQRLDQSWRKEFGAVPDYLTMPQLIDLLRWKKAMAEDMRRVCDEIIGAWSEHGVGYRRFLAGNSKWLKAAEDGNVVVAAWLSPDDKITQIGGQSVRLELAQDPFLILLMGSYFNSCLSADGGCNRDSAITNAYHANKAVVYVRDLQGCPLARRLVCLNQRFEMIHYGTYRNTSLGSPDDLDAAFVDFCCDWAAQAGVVLGNGGRPENLTGHFWYDDGLGSWPAEAMRSDGKSGAQ